MELSPLARSFYALPVLQVTRRLLGCHLVREWRGEFLVGRIVEAEAYGGLHDPAAHSFRGPTDRCRTMFGPSGRAYVYFTYGAHHCINVVAGARSLACAVLVRGLEPVAGVATQRSLRLSHCKPGRVAARILAGRDDELCNGPGKLTQALAIDHALDGTPLTQRGPLWLAAGKAVTAVDWTPRIGLGRNPAADWCWRCVERGSPFATSVRAHTARSRPTPTLGAIARRAE
jgi:DNA-3-methyladenine glycosylase